MPHTPNGAPARLVFCQAGWLRGWLVPCVKVTLHLTASHNVHWYMSTLRGIITPNHRTLNRSICHTIYLFTFSFCDFLSAWLVRIKGAVHVYKMDTNNAIAAWLLQAVLYLHRVTPAGRCTRIEETVASW